MNKKTIKPPTGAKFYLAYGSNMNLAQMRRRCPNAQKMFPVTLPGYRLAFRGRCRDGFGVATIIPDERYEVKGLLWAITEYCEEALDIYEGFPTLYTKETVTVETPSGKQINAMAYIMTPNAKPALPSSMYFRGILDGFDANGINPKPLFDAVARLTAPRKKKKKMDLKDRVFVEDPALISEERREQNAANQ